MNLYVLLINQLLKSGKNASDQVLTDRKFQLLSYFREKLSKLFFNDFTILNSSYKKEHPDFHDIFRSFKFSCCVFWIFENILSKL
jgi:hypothetical protein